MFYSPFLFIYSIFKQFLKIYNCNRESDYQDGFQPDIYMNELHYPLVELGNLNEPLLNQAISLIINKNILKSYQVEKSVKIIHYSLMKYEKYQLPFQQQN
ncbi:hypothetical protein FACS189437_07260 [Bacteroidia bacterium]|nr:hypothetical protein FACS189437_07260 [Bacteroidia bacterium]